MEYERLDPEEVINVAKDDKFLLEGRSFQVEEFLLKVGNILVIHHCDNSSDDQDQSTDKARKWVAADGMDCKVLRFGAEGWQSGKARICVEFLPDELEPEPDSEPELLEPQDRAGAAKVEVEEDPEVLDPAIAAASDPGEAGSEEE